MAKRTAPDDRGEEEEQDVPTPAILATEASLQAWFASWLFCLCGAHTERTQRLTDTCPFLVEQLMHAWRELATQSRVRSQRLVTEALVYAAANLPYASPVLDHLIMALEPAAVHDLVWPSLEQPHHPPLWLILPGLGDRFSGLTHPLPVCSFHDLTAGQHLAFAAAIADVVTGEPHVMVPWTEHAYGWLQNVILQNLRYHQLCHVAHELVNEAVRQDVLMDSLLVASPDTFLVDVLIQHGPRLLDLVDDTFQQRLTRLWETQALPLRGIRPGIHAALRRLPGRLYPYQEAVIQWMLEREQLPPSAAIPFPGGIVALSPGMGKTRTALALCFMRERLVAPTTLVLCPLGVIDEWIEENRKAFQGALTIRVFHRDYDLKTKDIDSAWRAWTQPGPDHVDVVVSTVDTLTNAFATPTREQFQGVGRVVVDEVHSWSNPKGKKYKRLATIFQFIPCRWGLTGTLFRNAREDIHAQLRLMGLDPYSAIDPKLLKHVYQLEYGPETIERKPRLVDIIEVPLNTLEWDLYRQVYQYGKRLRASGANFMTLMGAITRMRQCAISMDLIPPHALEEMRIAAQEEATRTSGGLFWSLYKTVVNKLTEWGNPFIEQRRAPPGAEPPVVVLPYPEQRLAGSTRQLGADYVSSKMAAVMRKMRDIAQRFPADKMIVFCNFSSVLHKLRALLQPEVEWHIGIYDGDVPAQERRALKQRFREDAGLRALLITYTTGGAGLNLQTATHVLEIDPVFNDAILEQAEARAWRGGQTRLVRMYRFLAPHTYEMRMEAIRGMKADDWSQMQQESGGSAADEDRPNAAALDMIFGE